MTNPSMKQLYVKTYGCQMNVYDSERMRDLLAPLGFTATDHPAQADLVILNTCHIRERASEKVFSELGQLRRLKEERRLAGADMAICVAGCVAQAEGDEIRFREPSVDLILGPQSIHKLPEMVARLSRAAGQKLETSFDADEKFDQLARLTRRTNGPSAFVSVQEGCDKFCTFCVVPYTRGAEFSRPVAQILDEIRALTDRGIVEVTLLGQNVNAYLAKPEALGSAPERPHNLAFLIEQIAQISAIQRIRYTTSHPLEMDDSLIEAHRDIPQLMPFLHLPVQSGSDRILKAMNRRHNVRQFEDVIDKVRAARPDIAVTSDFIAGFPGETEAEFERTLALARRMQFASAFSFKYSPRPGTPAAQMSGQVPEPEKDLRLARLQEILTTSQVSWNRQQIGKTLPVLFHAPGRHVGQMIGRTPYNQSVHVYGSMKIGETLAIKIVDASQNSLTGERFPAKEPAF